MYKLQLFHICVLLPVTTEVRIVVAGFPNPLPDTIHLLFSWFVCVRVRVWSCVRVLARLHVPVLVALLVALASRSTPVQWFRAHTDCACAKYIVLL